MNTLNTGKQDVNLGWNEAHKKHRIVLESNEPITQSGVPEPAVIPTEGTFIPSVSSGTIPQEPLQLPTHIPKKIETTPSSGQSVSSIRQRIHNNSARTSDNLPSYIKAARANKRETNFETPTPTPTKPVFSKIPAMKSTSPLRNAAIKTANSAKGMTKKAAKSLTGEAPMTLGSALFLLLIASAAFGAVVLVERVVVKIIYTIWDVLAWVVSFIRSIIWGTVHVAEDVALGSARVAENIVTAPIHATRAAENAAVGAAQSAENIAVGAAQTAGNAARRTAQAVGDAVRGTAQFVGDTAKGAAQSAENIAEGAANAAKGTAYAAGNAAMGTAQTVGSAVKGATHAAERVVIGTAHASENVARETANLVDDAVDATVLNPKAKS